VTLWPNTGFRLVALVTGKSKMSSPPDILTCLLGQLPEDAKLGTAPLPLLPTDTTRPYVTLTFAQSIDAKIAGAGGKQLIISGEESMKMTHW
jgi:2,5-diamino-6-(ribosylamino)-4(3H)-pyrimidinone 5'-phosphate reductase